MRAGLGITANYTAAPNTVKQNVEHHSLTPFPPMVHSRAERRLRTANRSLSTAKGEQGVRLFILLFPVFSNPPSSGCRGRIKGARTLFLSLIRMHGTGRHIQAVQRRFSGACRRNHRITTRYRTSQLPAAGPMPAVPSRCGSYSTVKPRGLHAPSRLSPSPSCA